MTKIKICGLTREQDILCVNAWKPAYVGFVFWEKSRRAVTEEQAIRLGKLLDSGIQKVGVFVDEKPEAIAGLLERKVIDIAQLHGHEDNDYIERLRLLTGKPIFQAFSMQRISGIEQVNGSAADLVLLDSGSGGTGNCFDWNAVAGITRPYLLAGGLDPANITQAICSLRPYGVDVSSGVETNGVKDAKKIESFVKAVQTADASQGNAAPELDKGRA